MPLNYNVKQTDTGTGGGYNTTFTIKPPKKKNPKPLWDYTTPVIQNKQPAPPKPVWDKYNTGWQPNSYNPYDQPVYEIYGGSNRKQLNLPPAVSKMPTSNKWFENAWNSMLSDTATQNVYAQSPTTPAKGDPSVQAFINLMRGTALSMPTFDPYETPITGDPYDHGAYAATTAPNVNPYQADIDWAMAKRQKNSPQDYFDRIVLNGRTYAVPNQMLNFASDYPWDTLPSWYAPPADFTGSPEWKEVTGPPAGKGAPTGGGWGGWGGGGGSFTPMPSSPRYTGYGGGYNPSRSPRPAYYQGRYGSSGGGGGYVGSQSQRGAWYGALLQWNI